MKDRHPIYLDHAAGTFLLPVVQERMMKYIGEKTANPSSIHTAGRQAASKLECARQDIASILRCQPSEIIFTSGGTEANNLAIRGLLHNKKHKGQHLITCTTEHPSVLESINQLVQEGYRVTFLSPHSNGQIDLDELRATICSETCLISLMWVNNETGYIHPVHEISRIAHEQGVPFHCDAVQALGHLPIRVDEAPIDALSFSGHKIGCPPGTGFLYLRRGNPLQAQILGGSQEHKQRGGTQNLPGAMALSWALQYHQDHLMTNHSHFTELQNHLQQMLYHIPGLQLNRSGNPYSPHILNCSIHHIDGETLFIRLDMSDINVSNGSACSSGSQAPSRVLTALGLDASLAQASLRISLGLETTVDDINRFGKKLETIVLSIRKDSTP